MLHIFRILLVLWGVSAAVAEAKEPPLLTPPPREIAWTEDSLDLGRGAAIRADSPAARQVGRVLSGELQRLRGISTTFAERGDASDRPCIVLELISNNPGRVAAPSAMSWAKWPPPRNRAEGYLLEITSAGATIAAETPRGLLYGCQTLLQLVPAAGGDKRLPGARIMDYPQLAFRGVHVCVFPTTELAEVRQAIMFAARYKLNAVVLEFWSSLKSKTHPETAYANAYDAEQVRPLIELGRAAHVDLIPMLNSWGHASGMRARSGEHAVLDRFPRLQPLYEPKGWCFCLSNPELRKHLFDRYNELLELFGPVKYFHAGMDEAWGHLGSVDAEHCRGDDPRELVRRHIMSIHEYFTRRNIRLIMWHDMFMQRKHPQLGRLSPANGVPPYNTHLLLERLPKDIIMAAWNYDECQPWPVPKYLHERGFPVVVCPWKTKANTVMLLDTAQELQLPGVLTTTWDALNVSLPSVAQAGVLSWASPGFDLKRIPFDHWLSSLRELPIVDLPRWETSLTAPETQ
jgi:hypothetical protein